MKKTITWLAIVALLLFVTGCTVRRIVSDKADSTKVSNQHSTEVKELTEKTTRNDAIPADSTFIKAFFECDSFGKVLMTELNTIKGRKLIPIIEWKDQILWLKVFSPIDSQKVYSEFRAKYEKQDADSTASKINTSSKEVKVKSANWYVKFSSWIVTLLIIAGIVYVIWRFKIYKLILR